jgi:K+-transporting ATPase A subunit
LKHVESADPMTEFITNFTMWVGQFVAVSTVVLVATHLFAKKRRAQLLAEEQSSVSESEEELEPAKTG